MERLKNKTAIVTGGAGGIGSAIVRAYANEGAKVAIADVNKEAGEKLSEELNHKGYDTRFIYTDLTDQTSLKACIEETVKYFNSIDILVNNAHASRMKKFMDITDEDLALSMNTGFYATFHLCQLAMPYLLESKGNIINFGSGAAIKGDVAQGAYAASKEAIRGLTRVIANEFGKDGININIISPIAYSDGVKQWREANPEYYQKVVEGIPLQRFGDIDDDIAPIAVFLASEESKYITGQTFMVDGGSIKLY